MTDIRLMSSADLDRLNEKIRERKAKNAPDSDTKAENPLNSPSQAAKEPQVWAQTLFEGI